MSKHTPGPWRDDAANKHGEIRIAAPSTPTSTYLVALVCPDVPDSRTQEANASVISAAPDLYAIVRAEYDAHGGFETLPIGYPPERAAAICAAIAKAEGGGA